MARRLSQLARLPVTEIRGVGSIHAAAIERAFDIETVLDLVTNYPYRVHDRSRLARIGTLREDDEAWIEGRVVKADTIRGRSGKTRFTYRLTDGSGFIAATFFTPKHHRMKEGRSYVLFGKVARFGGLSMAHPEVYPIGSADARVVPIYRQSPKESIESAQVEAWVGEALDRAGTFLDVLPERLLDELDLVDRTFAFNGIHRPDTEAVYYAAKKRLVFDELLRIQLALVLRKQKLEEESLGIAHDVAGDLVDRFVARLPFTLTDAQTAAIARIQSDLAGPRPMHRLLQGDVGSGKTVVAVAAMLTAVQGGHQAALMAPTEVLAEQHALGIRPLLDGFQVGGAEGQLFDERSLVTALLTNRTSGKERERLLAGVAEGTVDVVIGTHALIEEAVAFRSLGVVVIDEQHRFGVEQRAALRAKGAGGTVPDVLVMTATPIPRTAAMTVYGDLDVTEMRDKPTGRVPIETIKVDDAEAAWQRVRAEVAEGRQAYVVCPLIEESEKLEVRSAQATHDELQAGPLSALRLGLLHGRLKPAEKEATMEHFRAGRLDVLVATTVIEVGVDVPNATVMVVLDADRFGIAQLHQLRGRVGRGAERSYCYLVAETDAGDSARRLEALTDPEKGTDGFHLAEVDLEVRGEGTVLAARQKGRNDLKLASLVHDRDVVLQAREIAFDLVAGDPGLAEHPELLEEVTLFLDDEDREFLTKG